MFKIKTNYYGSKGDLRKIWKSEDPTLWDDLRKILPELPVEKPTREYDLQVEAIVDHTRLLAILDANIEIDIEPASSYLMKTELKDRLAGLARALGTKASDIDEGEKYRYGADVVIHMANFTLMGIKFVKVMEDACTDDLQEALNHGWVILAICPPNSQRRPDYVLGRTDAAPEINGKRRW